MANNTNTGSKKTTYSSSDLVNLAKREYEAVDEQAILSKYNQATATQFAAQQDQNRIAENNFYNQMYNTQRTAMDTIRQSNANAVSTGASRGVQAANELSALLGLQQESIASATEIANARRQTAQEETAAMLQNIVQASQDAATQRQQTLQSMIQAQSLRETELANASAAADRELTAITEDDKAAYETYLNQEGLIGPNGVYTTAYSEQGDSALNKLLENTSRPNYDTYYSGFWDQGGGVENAKKAWYNETKKVYDLFQFTDENYTAYANTQGIDLDAYPTFDDYLKGQRDAMPNNIAVGWGLQGSGEAGAFWFNLDNESKIDANRAIGIKDQTNQFIRGMYKFKFSNQNK
jgi:hypothetical protein